MRAHLYLLTLLLVLVQTVAAVWAAPPSYEDSVKLKASKLLPPTIVNGTNSQVLETVENDGYLNVYTLRSRFGDLKVVSTATLYERVHEFDAIAQMDKLQGTQEFANAVKAQAGKVAQGAKNLVTDPLGTAEKAVTGVGRFFHRIGSAISGDGESGGDSTLSEVSGFSKTKRAYAAHFQVDPYSRNPYLQDTLKSVSRAGFLGGALTSFGLGRVGGAAGVAISVSSTTKTLTDMVTAKSDSELADSNRDALGNMGVDDDLIDLFFKNDNFTITERTAIVLSLSSMNTTQNRQDYIKFAVLTDEPDMASFRRRQAELYAAYHQQIAPIREFHYFNQFAAARPADGSLLVMAPVDYLLWTRDVAAYLESVNRQLTTADAQGRQLWLSGTASPLARQNLKAAGWTLQEQAGTRLKPAKADPKTGR